MAVAGGTARCAGGQAYSHPVSERVTAPRAGEGGGVAYDRLVLQRVTAAEDGE